MKLGSALAAAVLATTTPTVPDTVVVGDVGDVRLVTAAGRLINEGDERDNFFVVLPDGATCPGDSANDQWRAHTFLVPEAEDVLGIWFGSTGPEPPWEGSRYPLFEASSGLPLSQAMLARNESAGNPGVVQQFGETNLLVQAQNGITSGRYRIGAACGYFRQTTQYWDLVLEVVVSGAGPDATLTWRVVESDTSAVPTAPADPLVTTGRVLIAIGVLLLCLVTYYGRRRSSGAPPSGRTPLTPAKES